MQMSRSFDCRPGYPCSNMQVSLRVQNQGRDQLQSGSDHKVQCHTSNNSIKHIHNRPQATSLELTQQQINMQATMNAQMTRHAFAAPAARPSLRSSRARPSVAPRATPPRPTEADPNNPLDQVRLALA